MGQEDLKFHLYYNGIDPGTDDKIPEKWMCVFFYERKNWDGINAGLKKLGVDLSRAEEDEVDEETEEIGIQMMLRTTHDWITFCDPWMKNYVNAPDLENGPVYHYEESVI